MKHTIKLFLHDSFFDAFSQLPKKIQKKTRELMKKFKANPTSAAINYEKISTFKDKNLRTVRVDQKYRAIVHAPTSGNGYHLLWVDNHDEAMDWAKNKVFEWNDNTQSFQMYNLPEKKIEPDVKEKGSPLQELSIDQLSAIGTPEHMLEVVSNIGTVEQLAEIQDNLPIDNFEYLYYLLEGISINEIFEEINSGKNNENAEESDNAQKHVYIITDDDDLEKILSGDLDKWKIFLHPTQRALAYRDYNGTVKVEGGAGTGKTVCAMHRAKFLVEKIDVFDKPILFTTYTKSLTSYLSKTIKELNLPENYLLVQNIDRLVFELAKSPEVGVIPESSGLLYEQREKEIWSEVLEYNASSKNEEFLFEEYNDVILENNVTTVDEYLKTSRIGRTVRIGRKDKIEIWNLVEDYKKRKLPNYSKKELCLKLVSHFNDSTNKPFSHIICDEVQDFSTVELRLLRSLVNEKPNDLFLTGDPFQNIYSRRINFSKAGINVKGRRSKKLKVNYRTTEEIKLLAVKSIGEAKFEDFDGNEANGKGYVSLMHGEEPMYRTFSTPEEEDRFIFETIEDWMNDQNVVLGDICIAARTKTGVDEIKKMLHNNDLNYIDLNSNKLSPKALRVSTFHNLKGHEFRFLIVKDLSNSTVPYKFFGYNSLANRDKTRYLKQERALFYVVFSRAIQGLVLTGVGEDSDWF